MRVEIGREVVDHTNCAGCPCDNPADVYYLSRIEDTTKQNCSAKDRITDATRIARHQRLDLLRNVVVLR